MEAKLGRYALQIVHKHVARHAHERVEQLLEQVCIVGLVFGQCQVRLDSVQRGSEHVDAQPPCVAH